MALPKMRLLDEAIQYVKKQDPKTALTRNALRDLMISGTLPCVMVGNRRLINLDVLEDYLTHPENYPEQKQKDYGKIRRIG